MNEKRVKRYYFGFLPHKWTIEFDGGKVSPIPDYDEVMAWVDQYVNEDGFLYPPTVHRVKVDPITMIYLEEIPKTERPAHLHKIPPSHELSLYHSGTQEDIRKGPGSFIIHLIAYLFGVRLQFYDWWVDGRLPIRDNARTHSISFIKETAEHFLSHCYRTWRGWSEKEQKLITNILFMHSRAPLYEWDWEHFAMEYMVFDGCWKLGEFLSFFQNMCRIPHGKRIKILCQAFDIPFKKDLVDEIVDLRNKLFHETLWDGSQPCTAVSTSAFMSTYHLRRLNQRLIPVLFGYKTPYVQTGWWFLGTYSFDQPSRR
jgi:hypothetical protein